LCLAGWAVAGVFSITPVRLYMGPKDRALALTITNDGETDVVLQAEAYDWKQAADGTDLLTPSGDLVLAPPILKLKPKQRQVVRLGMVAPRDAGRQLTYRVVMREVPEAVGGTQGLGIQIALALSLPVFVTPVTAKRDVGCELQKVDVPVAVRCSNKGTAYAQIRELRLQRGEQLLARFEGGQYILPGSGRAIDLKADAVPGPGPAQLVVRYDDGGETSADVVLP
jgi:fimbrial chaperone protein